MTVTASVREQFEQDGYVVFERLFAEADCNEYAAEIEAVLAACRAEISAGGGDPEAALASGVLVGLAARSARFAEWVGDRRLVDPLAEIWGERVEFLSDKVVYKSERTRFASPWHQDWMYWHGAHKISVWVALDQATRDNGCLMVVPGTHRAAIDHDLVQSPDGFGHRLDLSAAGIATEPVICELPRGGAVLFSDLTLHASLPNTSGAPRRAWIPTYRSGAVEDLEYEWSVARRMVRG